MFLYSSRKFVPQVLHEKLVSLKAEFDGGTAATSSPSYGPPITKPANSIINPQQPSSESPIIKPKKIAIIPQAKSMLLATASSLLTTNSCQNLLMMVPAPRWVPYGYYAHQRVACERYRSQTVSVIRIEVRGSAPAAH